MNVKLHNYNAKPGANCVLSSVSNVISYFDASVDDSAVLFLENGFSVCYKMENAARIADVKLGSNITKVAQSFLERNDIYYRYGNYDPDTDFQVLIGDIVEAFICGNPVIAVVDSSLLKHHMVYIRGTRREHVIVITGISDDGVEASDCYIPTIPSSTFHGTIPFNTLKDAWRSTGYKFIDIDYPRLKETRFNIDRHSLANSLKMNLSRYIYGGGKRSSIDDLYAFANDIPEYMRFFSEDEVRNHISEISFKIQFEGIMSSRLLLKKLLQRLTNDVSGRLELDFSEQLDQIVERWRKITLLLVRAGIVISKDNFSRIREYAIETIDTETRLFKNILSSTGDL